jgi:polyisoprenoid-binding protein YceI
MSKLPPVLRGRSGRIIAAIVALVLLVTVVAPFVYINFIKEDAAERLTLEDALARATTTTAAGDATTSTASSGDAAAGIDGSWTVTSGSLAQYRAKEVLFGQDAEATGGTESVSGTLTASGTSISAAEVEVDMTTIESDESNRDRQFHGRIMQTSTFPTASFVLTAPIDLGTLPADGEQITVEATGDLTLHGVTQSVTVTLEAALQDGLIVVHTTIPIAFDDYDIPDASGGPATVGRNGEIELDAIFTRG